MANENVNIVIKAVDKTKKSFRAVTVGLNAIKKAAFSMKSALIAVGIAGFGFLVKKSLNATDALGKMADKIGIGTAELGGLRHAAELTGIATNTLDMGLQRMVRRISEAAAGTGEAKGALIELGLSAEALNKLSPDQQFKAIADAMEGVTEQGEKVRLAMKLFDSEGVALVNTLKGGSAAISEMEQEAERLGLRLSRGLVAGVEKANDAMGTLGSYVANVFHRTVAELAPAIEAVTIKIREWMEASIQAAGGPKEFARGIASAFLEASKGVVTAIGAMINGLIVGINGIGRAVQAVLNLIPSVLPDLEFLNNKIIATANRITKMEDASVNTAQRKQKINAASLAAAKLELANLKEQVELGEYTQTFKPIKLIETESALKTLTELQTKLSEAGTVLGDTTTTGVSMGGVASIDLIAQAAEKRIDLQNQGNSRYESAQAEHYRNLIDQTHLYLQKQSAMQKASKVKDFGDLKKEGKDTLSTLSGHYKEAFALNKAFAIKDAIVNTFTAVSKALASAPFPINLGLGALALANGMAQVQSIRATSFREKGGPVSAGSPYIVGERGPELIVPSQAANVIPNDQLGGNNVTINVTTNDANGFDDLLTRSRGTLLGLMNQALNENGRPALV